MVSRAHGCEMTTGKREDWEIGWKLQKEKQRGEKRYILGKSDSHSCDFFSVRSKSEYSKNTFLENA